MKILILPKYHSEGPSSRYRYYNYFEWFLSDGHYIKTKPLLYDGYVKDFYENKKRVKRFFLLLSGIINRIIFLLFNKSKFDVIIIEKELVTFLPFFIEKILLKGTRIILDYDDNIDSVYQKGLAKIFLSQKVINLAKVADAITVGNNWYREFYKEIDQCKIYYLPTVIDRSLYINPKIDNSKNSFFTLVWIGSLTTVKYLKDIDKILVKLQKEYNFKLKVIGAKIKLECDAFFVDWNSETEILELQNSDIGIMPLKKSDWENGKCGFKLIQYMASGIPVVASESPANSEIISINSGFIARNDKDWYNFLSMLLSSEKLRKELGGFGKSRIFNEYSYQVWAPKFIKIIKLVLEKK